MKRFALLVLVVGCSRGAQDDPFAAPPSKYGGSPIAAPATPGPPHAHPALTPDEGRLVIDAPPAGAPGATAIAHVRVIPAKGFDINRKARFKLVLDASPDVEIARPVLTGGGGDGDVAGDADTFADGELAVPVSLVPRAAATVTGHFDFTVCAPNRCLTKTMPVAIQVATR